jgi:hypothetical protein
MQRCDWLSYTFEQEQQVAARFLGDFRGVEGRRGRHFWEWYLMSLLRLLVTVCTL